MLPRRRFDHASWRPFWCGATADNVVPMRSERAVNAPSDTQRWAIAIKQPNAWAVIHADKDVENRSATAIHAYRPAVGHRVYIHSCKGMTRAEYERAAEFMAKIGVRCP